MLPAPQSIPIVPRRLLLRALLLLFVYDLRARFSRFETLSGWATPSLQNSQSVSVASLVDAVDLACTWYPKTAPCLQRSAVLARLLRQRGIAAELLIGVQRFPFRSHAWVEVAQRPVNERARVREVYRVLDSWGAA